MSATVPIRRVQTINIRAGLLHRWLDRASVRVETAGGAGEGGAAPMRGWLAPLIRVEALPRLLQQVLPGFDYGAVTWQSVHPRAFRRVMKKVLAFLAVLTLLLAAASIWAALGVLLVLLPWLTLSTRKHVQHLGWAEDDEVVLMKRGWILRQVTVARINKIQVVATHQSPFDRRAAMARVKVDTAGAGGFSHRVDIPYVDQQVAQGLADRLSPPRRTRRSGGETFPQCVARRSRPVSLGVPRPDYLPAVLLTTRIAFDSQKEDPFVVRPSILSVL